MLDPRLCHFPYIVNNDHISCYHCCLSSNLDLTLTHILRASSTIFEPCWNSPKLPNLVIIIFPHYIRHRRLHPSRLGVLRPTSARSSQVRVYHLHLETQFPKMAPPQNRPSHSHPKPSLCCNYIRLITGLSCIQSLILVWFELNSSSWDPRKFSKLFTQRFLFQVNFQLIHFLLLIHLQRRQSKASWA